MTRGFAAIVAASLCLFALVFPYGVAARGSTPTPTPPPTATATPTPPGPAAPTNLSPANGAQVTVPVGITWSSVSFVSGILFYNWRVSPAASMSPIVVQGTDVAPQTQDTVSGLPNGTYYWQVQAVAGPLQQEVSGAWSAPQSFTVTGANVGEPAAPTLNPPQTGATTFHPYFLFGISWSAVPGTTSYDFQFDSVNASFAVLYTSHNVISGASTLSGNFPVPGTYYVRVQAVNASGARSVPSNVDTVVISYSAPLSAPPTPTGPPASATVTFPFAVSFTDVPIPQPQGYEVQFSTSSSFSTIEYDVPLIDPNVPFVTNPGSTSSYTVTQGLAGGTTYWRVRATEGDASASTAAVTAWSSTGSFTMSSAPPAVVSVTADTPALANGNTGFAQIQLSADAPSPNGSVVTLTSSNPNVLSVPSSVTIQLVGQPSQFLGAGIAVGQFQYSANAVSSPTPVTVTATLGSSSASTTITVVPPTLQSFTITSPVTGGGVVQPLVQLNGAAPTGGEVVSVSSSNAAVASVPATVTIASGAWSAAVPISTSAVTTNTPVTISVSLNGATIQSSVTLTPQIPPTSFVLNPTSVTNETSSDGTVTIAAPAATHTLLYLSSSNPSVASTNTTVTVPQGSTTGLVLVSTHGVTTSTAVTISVTGAGVTKSATLTVLPFGVPTLTPTATVLPAATSTSTPMTSATATPTTVPSATATPTTLPAASATPTPTATSGSGVSLASLTLSPTTVQGGNSSTGTVTLSGPAPSGGTTVTLSSNNTSVASVPSSVTVAAGASNATFTVNTQRVSSTTAVTITAPNGGASQSGVLNVTGRN